MIPRTRLSSHTITFFVEIPASLSFCVQRTRFNNGLHSGCGNRRCRRSNRRFRTRHLSTVDHRRWRSASGLTSVNGADTTTSTSSRASARASTAASSTTTSTALIAMVFTFVSTERLASSSRRFIATILTVQLVAVRFTTLEATVSGTGPSRFTIPFK